MQLLNRIQQITLLLFFFSINFEMLTLTPDTNYSISKAFAFLYIISILPQIQKFVRVDFVGYYMLPLVFFFGWLTFIGLVNINEIDSSFFDFSLFLNIILFWIMINHGRKDYLILEKGLFSFALGTIVIAFCFILGIGVEYQAGRLWMFDDDPNAIAYRTSMGIIILVLAVVQNRLNIGRYRYLLLVPIPLLIKVLFETGSRFGFIAFVLSFGAGILLYKTKNFWGKLSVFIFGIIALIIAVSILMQSEMMVERLVATAQSGDTAGRSDIWNSLLPIIRENLFFGYGRTGYSLQSTILFGQVTMPHNVILEILCYTGIVGLTVYFIFLYRIGMASLQSYKSQNLLLPILLLVPVAGMILSIQILTLKIGWIIFAYIISTLAIQEARQPGLIINN